MCRNNGYGMHRASTDMTPRLYMVRLRFPPLELVAVRRVRPPPPRVPYGDAEGDGLALAVALAAALAAAESSVVKDLSTIAATTSTGAGGSLKVLRIYHRSSCAFSRAIQSATPMMYDSALCMLFL